MVSLNRKDKWGPWIVEIRRKNKHILFTRVQRIVSKTQGFFFFFFSKRLSILWKTPAILPAVMRPATQFFLSLHSLAHSHPLILCEWLITCVVFVFHMLVLFFLTDMECADVPLLTPSSKEMMSQALKATFSGFTKEQQRLGIPKGILFTVGKGATQARVLGKALALPPARLA